jgi:hypothetical protein
MSDMVFIMLPPTSVHGSLFTTLFRNQNNDGIQKNGCIFVGARDLYTTYFLNDDSISVYMGIVMVSKTRRDTSSLDLFRRIQKTHTAVQPTPRGTVDVHFVCRPLSWMLMILTSSIRLGSFVSYFSFLSELSSTHPTEIQGYMCTCIVYACVYFPW